MIETRSNRTGRFDGGLGRAVAAWAVALGLFGLPALAEVKSPKVRVESGALAGRTLDGVDAFKGIPFAKPPLGLLRWTPPQPVEPWTGVRPAENYGAICMQIKKPGDNGIGPGEPSEDCLTLNIFRPSHARGPLPVMVWIHGGGFVQGSSTTPLYDGSGLAKRGVIVVTINYRLGLLGFFAHPLLTREARGGPVANYGLMDQIAALAWVRRNISAFGGDPRHVTIAGESAGGTAVNTLMASPKARGLFQRAITESGLGREQPEPLAAAEGNGREIVEQLGYKADSTAALRAIPASAFLHSTLFVPDNAILTGQTPILDGQVVVEPVISAFENGHEAPVPLIIGTNDLEVPPLYTSPALRSRLATTPGQADNLRGLYGGSDVLDRYLLSDLLFVEPARRLALLHSQRAPVYFYRFAVVADSIGKAFKGAPHASEIPYVFGTTKVAAWPLGPRDEQLSVPVGDYWAAFAKTGEPNGEGRPEWPRFDGKQMLLIANEGVQPISDPSAARLDAITKLYGQGFTPLLLGAQVTPVHSAPAKP